MNFQEERARFERLCDELGSKLRVSVTLEEDMYQDYTDGKRELIMMISPTAVATYTMAQNMDADVVSIAVTIPFVVRFFGTPTVDSK